MPPIYVHGYGGGAKKALCTLRLNCWVTYEQSMQGSLKWCPTFMSSTKDATTHVQASAGFRVSAKVSPTMTRSPNAARNWMEVLPSGNDMFLKELPTAVPLEATWPLWDSLVETKGTSRSSEDAETCHGSNYSRTCYIECPGFAHNILLYYVPKEISSLLLS